MSDSCVLYVCVKAETGPIGTGDRKHYLRNKGERGDIVLLTKSNEFLGRTFKFKKP